MKIGIVAMAFPPAIGGMENHAAGLAEALSVDHDITVFTKDEYADVGYDCPYVVKPVLVGRVVRDKHQLKHEHMDAWLTLSAPYACLSCHLTQPVFAYCHGNDFLNPSLHGLNAAEAILVDGIGALPYLWRFKQPTARRLYHRRLLAGLAQAKLIFVNSCYTRALLTRTFPGLATVVEVSNPGVSDLFFLKSKQPITEPSSALRLLTVARLASYARKKNVDNMLRALASIKDEVRFLYTVAGDGNIRNELEALSADLGISEHTEFIGNISSDQVVAYLDEADLLLQPSRASVSDVESFGIVYAEAAARGVPSLISKAGGATDAVADGLSGIVIDGAEPEDIAEGIRRFQRTREQFDSAAIRDFANHFRWPEIAERMSARIKLITRQ